MQTLWLYGLIGDEPGEISAIQVRDELATLRPTERVLLRVNSPGGAVFEAVAIRRLLAEHPGGVDVQVDGLAASAASYIATVGQTVAMAPDSMQMIHEAWALTIGPAADHHATGDALNTISDVLTGAYSAKSGKSKAEIRAAMQRETWLTGPGAVEFGLADLVLDEAGRVAASRRSPATSLAAMQRRLDSIAAAARI